MNITGWDIGGVNTKAAAVQDGRLIGTAEQAFEIQRAPHLLGDVLRELAGALGSGPDGAHAITMTAELSQAFLTKRDGVNHVVESIAAAFGKSRLFFYGTDERFHDAQGAREAPLVVAAANWAATAAMVAEFVPDAILIDTGTTTTDVIPMTGGRHVCMGRTDPERLASGELVYTGAVRTPVEAIVSEVPYGEAGFAAVSAEGFALSGDVHVWRGSLASSDYSTVPPDGRPPTREFAGTRLARVVCGDREMLGEAAVTAIADAVAGAQIARIASAIRRVRSRHPALHYAIVTGIGSFLAREAALLAGLTVVPMPTAFDANAPQCSAAAAVALLLDRKMGRGLT